MSFASVGSLAAVAGGWAVQASQFGRAAALLLMALFGLSLLFPALAERLGRPLVRLGERLSWHAEAGAAPGARWAPRCCSV
ncbi:hypothetical protein [Cyanobium sp. ATX-6F1]|uniref:hypothetical protein n=1 Tax=Cyanobium sp. ATX-6F1 TaxID=3137388 RepID=UPI0039BE211B